MYPSNFLICLQIFNIFLKIQLFINDDTFSGEMYNKLCRGIPSKKADSQLSQVELESCMNHSTRYLNCTASWYNENDGANKLPHLAGRLRKLYLSLGLFLHQINDVIELFSCVRIFFDNKIGSIWKRYRRRGRMFILMRWIRPSKDRGKPHHPSRSYFMVRRRGVKLSL